MHFINAADTNDCSKRTVCEEVKFAKIPFKPVTSKSIVLELIQSDLADFKNTRSKGSKKYYISYDFSRYTKIYLLKTKDEVYHMF